MRIGRARYAFSNSLLPVIDSYGIELDWTGQACLSGASGIGKTTFFRLLAGWYYGHPESICDFEDKTYPFRDIYFIGAHRSLLPWKNVRDNLLLHLPEDNAKDLGVFLAEVGLSSGVEGLYPYQLSAGMYKRIELIVGVARNPELLLLDEFYSSIADTQKELVRAFISRRRDDKMTWIIAHEEGLRHWVGGPDYRFVIQESTIVGITLS